MSDFNIEPTRFTPSVVYTGATNLLDISGRSFPENTLNFYARLEALLPNVDLSSPLLIRFYFEYLNSSSIISVLKVIKYFEDKHAHLSVEWHFDAEDEEIEAVGKDIDRLIDTNIKFCEAV